MIKINRLPSLLFFLFIPLKALFSRYIVSITCHIETCLTWTGVYLNTMFSLRSVIVDLPPSVNPTTSEFTLRLKTLCMAFVSRSRREENSNGVLNTLRATRTRDTSMTSLLRSSRTDAGMVTRVLMMTGVGFALLSSRLRVMLESVRSVEEVLADMVSPEENSAGSTDVT